MNAKKILLVDDVKFFLELEKAFLKRTNCEVFTASNGREALEVARRERPDLILMDLFMPEMNGDEACREIKGDPLLKKVPVIMVTKAGEDEEKGRCLMAGCDDFATKPINKLELLEKVRNYLDIMVRQHVRVPIDAAVHYTADGQSHSGRLHDISEGGLFIKGGELLAAGTKLALSFKMPLSLIAIETEGEVMRVVAPSAAGALTGMGIRFIHLPAVAKGKIADYIKAGNYLV